MRYERPDGIFEIECDKCHMRLTEVIVGSMPRDWFTARTIAVLNGWVADLEGQICVGCWNVSK